MNCFAFYRRPGMPGTGVKKGSVIGKRDYTPVSWDHYFEKMSDVKVDDDVSSSLLLTY